jgi:hypothetical protein
MAHRSGVVAEGGGHSAHPRPTIHRKSYSREGREFMSNYISAHNLHKLMSNSHRMGVTCGIPFLISGLGRGPFGSCAPPLRH